MTVGQESRYSQKHERNNGQGPGVMNAAREQQRHLHHHDDDYHLRWSTLVKPGFCNLVFAKSTSGCFWQQEVVG